jgi:ribose transport system permease protein
VVLGGTSLAGGSGSVTATAVGAVFLTQLQQVLTANGAAQSIEYIIQGSIIALGMLLRRLPRPRIGAAGNSTAPPRATGPSESGDARLAALAAGDVHGGG